MNTLAAVFGAFIGAGSTLLICWQVELFIFRVFAYEGPILSVLNLL